MSDRGVIWSVYTQSTGDSLAVDTPSGSTTLILNDSVDFEEEGGLLQLGETGQIIGYSGYNPETEEVFLTSATTSAQLAGAPVYVYPISQERRAEVNVEDEGENLACRIPYTMYAQIPVGARNIGERREVVSIIEDEGDWVIEDIIGEPSTIDGSAINPETTIPVGSMTDGVPPEVPPIITVYPFSIGALRVSWERIVNRDPVTYRVYAGLVSPDPNTSDYLMGMTSTNSMVVSSLKDGTGVPFDQPTFFRVVPFDGDGDGPTSNEASSTPRKAGQAEISADYAYLGEIEGNKIKAGTVDADRFAAELLIASKIRTGLDGSPRTVIDGPNFQIFGNNEQIGLDANPNGIRISGEVNAGILKSFTTTELGGSVKLLGGGTMTVSEGIYDAPPVGLEHVSVPEVLGSFADAGPPNSLVYGGHRTYNPTLLHRVGINGNKIAVTRDLASTGARSAAPWQWDLSSKLWWNATPPPAGYFARLLSVHGMAQVSTTQFYFLVKVGLMSPDQMSIVQFQYRLIRVITSSATPEAAWNYTPKDGAAGDAPVMCGVPGTTAVLIAKRIGSAVTIDGISYVAQEAIIERVGLSTGTVPPTSIVSWKNGTLKSTGPLVQIVAAPLDVFFDAASSASMTGDNQMYAIDASDEGFTPYGLDKAVMVYRPSTGAVADGPVTPYWYSQKSKGVTYSWSLDRFVDTRADGSAFNVFSRSSVQVNATYHTYTLYDSTDAQESKMAPVYQGSTGSGGTGIYARYVSEWRIPGQPSNFANKVRIYSGMGTARTDLGLIQTFDLSKQDTRIKVPSILPPVSPVNNPPAASNLSGGNPFEIKSESGGFSLKGDGSGAWPGQKANSAAAFLGSLNVGSTFGSWLAIRNFADSTGGLLNSPDYTLTDTSATVSYITIAKAGWYVINGYAYCDTSASTRRIAAIFQSDTAGSGNILARYDSSNTGYWAGSFSWMGYFAAGTKISAGVWTQAAANFNQIRLGIARLGAAS